MIYQVQRTIQSFSLEGDWHKDPWNNVPCLDVKNYMGKKPEHQPRTQAKLLYDENYIYVIFRVEDRYVRAVARKYQGPVCLDSCVEFFFTPGGDIDQGYFNVEINCGGTLLFYHQTSRDKNARGISDADAQRVEIFHSLPKKIDPEITELTTWIIEYRIPFEVIEKYAPVIRPAPGVIWRANFYKCADATSHPHWLTWSVIDRGKPDFHRPEFFGMLEFM